MARAGVIAWLNPADGFWDVGTNWIGDAAPVAGDVAEIAVEGVYTVTVRSGRTVRGLFLTNPEAVIEILNFQSLSVLPQPGDASAEVFNNSVIVVNSNQGISTTSFNIGDELAPGVLAAETGFAGEVVLNVSTSNTDITDARLSIAGGGLHAANHTVRGKGQVLGEFTNEGLIIADRENGEIRITGDVTQGATGVVGATAGGILGIASGGVVRGGLLTTDDSGRIAVTTGTGTIEGGATLIGRADVLNQFTLQIGPGGLVNDGVITINSNQGISTTRMLMISDESITGSGAIDLNVSNANSDLQDATLTTDTGITATNGPDHTVRGKGRVTGTWINNGTIDADRAGQDLSLSGVFDQTGGGTIMGSMGGFSVLNGAQITGGFFDGQTGGAAHAASGTNTISGATNLGAMGVRNAGSLHLLTGGLTNNGTLTINTSQGTATTTMTATESATIDGVGLILFNISAGNSDYNDAQLGASAGEILTIGPGQTVAGKGRLFGDVVLEGTIAPGSSINTIRVDPTESVGSLNMTETAEYHAELASTSTHDRITATVPVALSGTLRVTPIDDFDPPFPSGYTIITATDITGRFDTLIYEGELPPGAVARVLYTTTQTVFAVTCPADFSLPVGLLDLADITAFITAFTNQDPVADLAPPFGLLDLADLVAFVTSFTAGCH